MRQWTTTAITQNFGSFLRKHQAQGRFQCFRIDDQIRVMWVCVGFARPASLVEVIEIQGRRHDEEAIAMTILLMSQLEQAATFLHEECVRQTGAMIRHNVFSSRTNTDLLLEREVFRANSLESEVGKNWVEIVFVHDPSLFGLPATDVNPFAKSLIRVGKC